MRYYTSDTHFFHANIIEYCNRPFTNVTHMDKSLIREWNRKVTTEDDIYILGDFAFARAADISKVETLCKKLNGRKHLIYGNHDVIHPHRLAEAGIQSLHYPYLTLDNGWHLIHDPSLAVAFPKGSVVLAGHIHDLTGDKVIANKDKLVINVGVDIWNYQPVSEEEIENLIKEWKT